MQKRNVLDSPRLKELKKHQQKVIFNKAMLFLFLFLLAFVGIVYLSHINKLRITDIKVSGNTVTGSQSIQDFVKEELSGNYFWVFPKDDILYYSKSNLEKGLKNKFSRLKDITFSTSGNNLEINVTERIPKYMWCGNIPPEETSSTGTNTDDQKCYFMDDTGYIFDVAPYFSSEVYFEFYGLLAQAGSTGVNSDSPIGSYFSRDNFSRLASFKDTLISIGLKPLELYIEDNKDIEVFLPKGNLLPNGPKLILNTNSDFESVAENLQAALTTAPLQAEFKNKYSSLLYIDLRFGNKVYYKFQ